MSFDESKRNGTTSFANLGLDPRAAVNATLRSSPVMPYLSSLGGVKVMGKYDVRDSKSEVKQSSEAHSGAQLSRSVLAKEKESNKFRGSRSSSITPTTPSPRTDPSPATSALQSSSSNLTRSKTALRTCCVWEGVCTPLKSDRAMCAADGAPSSSFNILIWAACCCNNAIKPFTAPSTHCQSQSFAQKKCTSVSTCLKLRRNCELGSSKHSANKWIA
mmetsp:Transcript_6249/g.15347  ORF Transcript_6249/g.15347 Transcript_6249/m.15347 type:complete len:217 (-) Transcript_6249:279-929(-)